MPARQPSSSFTIIGENIHATRVLRRDGPRIETTADGVWISFVNAEGADRRLPVPQPILESGEYAAGKLKHVRSALLLGLGADGIADPATAGRVSPADGAVAREYLVAMAHRQVQAGAAYLDLNVDELSASAELRSAALAWLVELVEGAVSVPVALDSSSAAVLRAGLDASRAGHGQPLLNSASIERSDVLDLAAGRGCAVVASAVGLSGMPSNAEERIANAHLIVEAAIARGIAEHDLFVDPLVVPAAVEPDAGRMYLDAVRALRATYGPRIHITGGLSNVSFGLPARGLLNEVFVGLAVEAGADSGIIDPIATNVARATSLERTSEAARFAEALLLGRDEFGGEFLMAFRAGRLAGAAA